MEAALATPGLQSADRSLFLAYERLLQYIKLDIQGGRPVGEAILADLKRIIAEAPKDTDLANMPDGIIGTYIPGLVEILQEQPKPTPVQVH